MHGRFHSTDSTANLKATCGHQSAWQIPQHRFHSESKGNLWTPKCMVDSTAHISQRIYRQLVDTKVHGRFHSTDSTANLKATCGHQSAWQIPQHRFHSESKGNLWTPKCMADSTAHISQRIYRQLADTKVHGRFHSESIGNWWAPKCMADSTANL